MARSARYVTDTLYVAVPNRPENTLIEAPSKLARGIVPPNPQRTAALYCIAHVPCGFDKHHIVERPGPDGSGLAEVSAVA